MLSDLAADFSHESVIPDGTVLPRAVPYAGHAHPDSHLAPPGGRHWAVVVCRQKHHAW